MLVRAYLRASTDQQDAKRAKAQLQAFARGHGLSVAAHSVENESGAKLARPELFRLLADSHPGNVLLIEQVDRLSRLTADDWQKLRTLIDQRHVRIVALDLPTSWTLATPSDRFTGRVFQAINGMMLDVLTAVTRKDYDDRRRRQAQGQAKAAGIYKGRKENVGRNTGIANMLKGGASCSDIHAAFGCSRTTIAKIAKRIAPAKQAEGAA